MRSALLVFAKGSTLYPKLFGAAGVRDDYFYLTYSGLVARGIDEHATAIDYGGGNHLSKLLRGARLRWHVAALRVYDRRLQARLGAFWPVYGRAKTAYFRTLASRYGVGEAAPREFAPTLGGGPSR
jgi:hypothetical protein